MRKLDHPNIVRYLETYNDKNYLFLVNEYIEGTQILEHLTRGKGISETTVCNYIKDIVAAIHRCHLQGVIHRDINPDSIRVSKMGHVKIVDFGFCTYAKKVEDATAVVRHDYLAPEIGKDKHITKKADVWSIGCLMHLLLSGVSVDKIRAAKGISPIKYEEFHGISSHAISLMKGMLVWDAEKRISTKKILESPWFTDNKKE